MPGAAPGPREAKDKSRPLPRLVRRMHKARLFFLHCTLALPSKNALIISLPSLKSSGIFRLSTQGSLNLTPRVSPFTCAVDLLGPIPPALWAGGEQVHVLPGEPPDARGSGMCSLEGFALREVQLRPSSPL